MNVIIVAYSKENRVIGKDGKIPWHLPEDMEMFKKTTENHTVVMGRKTWDSLPERFKPLDRRINIIISKTINEDEIVEYPATFVAREFDQAILFSKTFYPKRRVFIIGGQSIYEQALQANIVDEVIATEVYKTYEGDTFFPVLDNNWKGWTLIRRDEFNILTYQKVNNE
jgi:dihydrofolate reductase